MTVTFHVQGEPKGQPRPRAFAMKMGNGKFSARVFDAGTAEGWKSLVAAAAKPALPPSPFTGPVQLRAGFVFRRPKHHLRTNGDVKPNAPRQHTGKPDIDNLLKAVMDALTQLGGIWLDDTQVALVTAWKDYGFTPGAVIEIKPMEVPS
jgi:Holliday junction resolvase RusA-like endonuclease